MVTGRATGIDVPIKMINPGLWDRLAQNAHRYDMTIAEYCDFLLEKEYALNYYSGQNQAKMLRQDETSQSIMI
ncbi:MAG TPA: hypothetical protein VH796_00040 [Nitrososphaeraceae archaeon]|jgi:hypothetical protein